MELVVSHTAHRPDSGEAADDIEEAGQRAAGEAREASAQAAMDVSQVATISRRIGIEPAATGEESGPGNAVRAKLSVSNEDAGRSILTFESSSSEFWPLSVHSELQVPC